MTGKNIQKPCVLIMAGGTGGHVIPALSIAQTLRQQQIDVEWLGTTKGLESQLVPAAQFPIHYIKVAGLRGKGISSWLKLPWRLWHASCSAKTVLKKVKPDLVIGLGGFVSGPGALAARWLKIPLWIHEQNAIAGLTNRLLAHGAQRVFAAFPNTFAAKLNPQVIGNPIRAEIAAIGETIKTVADMQNRPLHLLIIGGSLGALALNQIVPRALAQLSANERPIVHHQTGRNKLDETKKAYHDAAVDSQCDEFIDDMAAAYQWADLVICRAGALTVSELAAAAKPAILIPYPYAVDDHQRHNAMQLSQANAAILLPQSEATPKRLSRILINLLQPEVLAIMAKAACSQAHLQAVNILVTQIKEFFGER